MIRITWDSREDSSAFSWATSRQQARDIIKALKKEGQRNIIVEHHLIPVTKHDILSWLVANDIHPTPERIEAIVA